MHISLPDTHWLFAGRFVLYVLCIVLIWGTFLDWIAYLAGKAPKPVWAYHMAITFACLAIAFATPDRYEVLRRLFKWHPNDLIVNTLLVAGLLSGCVFFICAQITRGYNRGASRKRIVRGVWFALVGIVLLIAVGAGFDVRLAH
jgi:hypothetical protein